MPTTERSSGLNLRTCELKKRPTQTQAKETSDNGDMEKEAHQRKENKKAKEKGRKEEERILEDVGFKRQRLE